MIASGPEASSGCRPGASQQLGWPGFSPACVSVPSSGPHGGDSALASVCTPKCPIYPKCSGLCLGCCHKKHSASLFQSNAKTLSNKEKKKRVMQRPSSQQTLDVLAVPGGRSSLKGCVPPPSGGLPSMLQGCPFKTVSGKNSPLKNSYLIFTKLLMRKM